MLTVSIHLHGDVVPVVARPQITGLNRAADAEVHGVPKHDRAVRRRDGGSLVIRTVVDDADIRTGQRVANRWQQRREAARLVVRGDDD